MSPKIPKTILVTNRTNIRYLSGFSGTAGHVVMVGKKGFLFTDARYYLVAKRVLPRSFKLVKTDVDFKKVWRDFLKTYRIGSLGFEGGSMTVAKLKYFKKNSPRIKFVDIGSSLDSQRIVKRPDELRAIMRAQQITDRIFSILKKWLKRGVTEKEIAWKIVSLAHELGADDVSFPAIVGFNENSASPHHQNTDRKLNGGDMILIDMGVIYNGYCSDMTRMLFTKQPTAEQEAVYNVVLLAQTNAIKELRAGMSGVKGDMLARSIIKKAGYGDKFGHSLGHGVGLDIHELPNLAQKYKGKIPRGTVVTVEPGVYLPGKFGVRLEDMVVVGAKGVRNITKSSKALNSCIIKLK